MTEKIVSDIIDSNVFVVEKNGKFLIFDAGAKTDDVKNAVESIMKKIGQPHQKPKVLGVFLTHGHYDHCFFAQDYAKTFGCKIYASGFAKEYLQNPDWNYSEGKFWIEDFSDLCFLDGDGQISLGDFKISYYQLGGHSKSDMCFLVGDEIFVGDVLIGRDMGRLDLFGGDKVEMQKSLEKLVSLDYAVMHSGHGDDNPKQLQDKVAKLWIRFLGR